VRAIVSVDPPKQTCIIEQVNECYTNLMLEWHRHRPVHASWLVAVLCFGVTLGIITSFAFSLSIPTPVSLFIAFLLFVIGFRKKRVYSFGLVLVAGILVGFLRGNSYRDQLSGYEAIIGKTVTVQGVVADDSDIGQRGEAVLRLGDIIINNYSLGGTVWVSISQKADIKRGDNVTIKGKLSNGFGSFAASMYQADLVKVERPVPGNIALTARDTFADAVRWAIPEPEASLGVGYVVGQRRSLPEELDEALRAAGLTHVVVASGYNLTILVSVARRLFVKISKFLAAFFSGSMTIAFMAVTGMSPSMSRAGLVTGLGLLAWYYGRRFHPIVLLLLAAAVTLLIQPAYAKNDLGWQLSFASFTGVLIVGPLLQNYFFGAERPSAIRQILFETISAWVCTVPLIVLAFGEFSNVAILANILVLPFVPLAMLLTFIAGSVALIVPALAAVAGFPAFLLLKYMTKVTLYLGNVPWAQTELALPPYLLIAYYAALIAICGLMWRKTRFNFTDQLVTY